MKHRQRLFIIACIFICSYGVCGAQTPSSTQQPTAQTPTTQTPPQQTPPSQPPPSSQQPTQQQPATPPPQQPVPERTPPAAKPSATPPPAPSSTPPSQTPPAAPSPSPAPTATTAPTPTTQTPTVPLSPVIPPGASLATPTQTGATNVTPITRDEAVRLALGQASAFQQSALNERIAAEDVRQARAAFLPRLSSAPSLIYTTPSSETVAPGVARPPSFIAANAVSEYQALLNFAGEVDTSGRLRATLQRNIALLEAAHAGTEVARRALIASVDDAYFGLALASARRRAAELNLSVAQEFERVTSLLLQGGEVAPVDLTRARLQTETRRDELEQARANESVAADSLRVLIGYDFTRPVATTDLLMAMPELGEIERFTAEAIKNRPEFAQFDAERRAAEQEIRLARDERRPQITYNIGGGFDSDSLRPVRIGQHAGVSATVGVSVPIFDNGISRSRERQAQLRAQVVESQRLAALRQFAQTFYSARTSALSAQTRIRLLSDSLRDAENNLNVSLARYRAGEAQIIEVTDAQNTLITLRTAFYQAIYDYQTARARLLQATGQ